jgi:ABC-type sugar transport system substrate-binding protein
VKAISKSTSTATRNSVPSRAKTIELILAHRSPDDSEAIKINARIQAGVSKVRLQTTVVGEGESPGTQVELVRKAVTRRPQALIVEPSNPNDPELVQAIAEARSRGIAVVLTGVALAGKPADKGKTPAGFDKTISSDVPGPLTLVEPQPFSISAASLVGAAITNASNAKLDPASGSILMINTASDNLFDARAQALRAALRGAGVANVEELRFGGQAEEGKKKLLDLLRKNRGLGVVMTTDNLSSNVAYDLANELGTERPFVIAGYTTDATGSSMTRAGELAAFGDYSPERLIRKAIATAALAAGSQKVPEKVELDIPVTVSPPGSSTPKMNAIMKSKRGGN